MIKVLVYFFLEMQHTKLRKLVFTKLRIISIRYLINLIWLLYMFFLIFIDFLTQITNIRKIQALYKKSSKNIYLKTKKIYGNGLLINNIKKALKVSQLSLCFSVALSGPLSVCKNLLGGNRRHLGSII